MDSTVEILVRQTEKYLKLAVADFKHDDYQLAVLHAAIAAELLLKAKLWSKNRGLVYEDIDGRRNPLNTVRFGLIPKRLDRCGFPLSDTNKAIIGELCEERNHIAHFLPNPQSHDLRTLAMRTFDFVSEYLEDEFKKDLRALVPTTKGALLKRLSAILAKKLEYAKRAAKLEGNVEKYEPCPHCGNSETMSKRDGFAFCHYCQKESRMIPCGLCDEPSYTANDFDLEKVHDGCMENYEPPDPEPYWK